MTVEFDEAADAIARAIRDVVGPVERLARIEEKVTRHADDLKELKRLLDDEVKTLKKVVYSDHDPVIQWARGVMENSRKVMTAVYTTGVLLIIGLLVQVYYLLNKGK